MTTTNTTSGCDRLLEDLASLADGDPSAVRDHADHLSECDACRDARHDAREVSREIAFAGEGFRENEDFHARLMRAVDQALAAAPSAQSEPRAPSPSIEPEARGPSADPESRDPSADSESRGPSPDSERRDPSADSEARAPSPEPERRAQGAESESRDARPRPEPEARDPRPETAPQSERRAPNAESESRGPSAESRGPSADSRGRAPSPEPETERRTPSPSARTEPERRAPSARVQPLAPKGRGVGVRGRALVALAAAAVLVLAFFGARALWSTAPTRVAPGPVATAAPPLTGRLDLVARSGAEPGATGVTLRVRPDAPGAAIADGDAVPAGGTIRTDTRTRARLVLSDGSAVVLDHDTELVLDAAAPRRLRLARGAVLADVAHLTGGPRLALATAQSRVEVLGTKLVVTAADDRTNVEVIRGVVRVAPLGARTGWAEVQAGQEGVVGSDGKPRVMPASHLAGAVQWAELDRPDTGDERGSSGLGVLRARRPGEAAGREHPLSLSLHRVSVRIAGTVARTEIEERFANDGPNVLEGTYEFPLPADARIVRLALDVDGRLVEGAIVERERASQIWAGVLRNATPVARRQKKEEFVWVPGPWRDPALLEWRGGGRFGLRIFPIPAHGARRIVLAYEQVVAPRGEGRRYVYPLPHPSSAQARAARFEMDARVVGADAEVPVVARGYPVRLAREGQATHVRFAEDAFVPAGDFVIDWALPGRDAELRAWAYQKNAGDGRGWALVALRPTLPGWTEFRRQDVALVVDSSQSMTGERYARASELAAAVVAEMDRRDRFLLLACDARCQVMPGGAQAPSSEAATAARAWLGAVQPAGASDLAMALRTAARTPAGDRSVRVVYIGDGTATVGPRRTAALEAEVAALAPAASVTTVGVGGEADEVVLAAIARAGGGQFVAYRPTESLAAATLAVVETMIGPRLEDARLELPRGLEEIAPSALPTIRSGDEVIVTARLAGPVRGDAILRGRVAGVAFERRYPLVLEPTGDAGNAFVPAVWAERRIRDLERADAPDAVDRIVALSKEYGVVSRHTSLLVLESEAMFRAFGVEQSAPVATWSGEDEPVATEVSGGGDALAQSAPRGQTASSFRVSGRVGELSDREHGVRGLVAPGALGHSTTASGSIDRAAVQRVVRAHVGEIQAVFERALLSNPNAGGRVVVSFTIGASGAVEAVRVTGGEGVPSAALSAVVGRWRFPPPPGGGSVQITYPFLFRTMDGGGGPIATRDLESAHAPAKSPDPDASSIPRSNADAPRNMPAGGRPGFGSGRWMRRTWVREGAVRTDATPRPAERAAVERAQASLDERPDSRDRHEALVRALARIGDVDRTLELAQKWLGRDPLDPDAILALSDALARKGRRDEALRVLSGVVDVRPDERALHERLAAAYERIGDADRACAHRVTLAEIAAEDVAALGAAVRCEKGAGRDAAADRIVARIGDVAVRDRVTAQASRSVTPARVAGDVTIEASWDGDEDVDVALVTSKGSRLSWMGGRATIAAEDAGAAGRERLGLRFAPAGSYLVELTRTGPGGDAPVRGRVTIQVLGERRTVDFVLEGDRTAIARIDVTRREVLAPVF